MEKSLTELFQEWEKLNNQVAESFGNFDFDSVKEIRKNQRVIEDTIFSILLNNAPDNIKKILPEECGDMEVGYESESQKFFFVMLDPETEADEEAEVTLIAINIDTNKNVVMIENFNPEEV
jgi:hypothetical protein